MERIAIPLWMGRVSPVFDTATRLLLVELNAGSYVSRETVDFTSSSFSQRLGNLSDMAVDTVLCGAISRPFFQALTRSGIRVIAFLSGDAYDIIKAYSKVGPDLSEFMLTKNNLAGRRRRRRRRGGANGGRRRQNETGRFDEDSDFISGK